MFNRIFLLGFFMVIFLETGMAAKLPIYYPDKFDRIGVIDAFYVRENRVVINDMSYKLATSTRIYTPHSKIETNAVLKSGVKIGVTYGNSGDGLRVINEVWVLPRGYKPQGYVAE